MKLNLGCGFEQRADHINIDRSPVYLPDIIRDIEKGLPFSDNSCKEVLASHILEHIRDIHFVMFEIWRVLEAGGRLFVRVPIGKGWLNCPEHVTPFDKTSYRFFTDWNMPGRSGYNFKLVRAAVVGEDLTEELKFELEAIK